jgi:dGTPase
MAAIVEEIRAFLWDRMYRHYKVCRQRSKAWRVVQDLFGRFMEEPQTLPSGWKAMHRQIAEAGDENLRARFIADYIAGMTDRYAMIEHGRLFDLYDYRL